MIGAVVTDTLPGPMSRAHPLARFGKTVDADRNVPDVRRKPHCHDETTGRSLIFCQLESLATAQTLLTSDFQKRVAERKGATPDFYFPDTLMVLDNTTDSVSSDQQD